MMVISNNIHFYGFRIFVLTVYLLQRVAFLFSVYSVDGNENRFLREFVRCAPHSAGCRLARWLQPESVVEPDSCELSLSTAEVRCGWPAKFTVRTRDQYGNLVQSTGLKVSAPETQIQIQTMCYAVVFS